jgi:acyl carrier protein
MADSHMAFLRTVEASFVGLGAMLTGAPLPTNAAPPAYVPGQASTSSTDGAGSARAVPPAHVAAVPASLAAPASPHPEAATVPAPASRVTPPAPSVDLEQIMLAVVSEKTGYPAEMLGPDMALEADLGIDSIKRVEILSAMRERAPGLREVKPTELATLRTLGQIVEHMRVHAGGNGTTNGHAHAAATSPPEAPVDLEQLMLAIVSEKTGYPAEMLGPDMALEADLGIDSIKRVEILSAMRERAPGLREVKPTELATLRTLGQIVEHMRAHGAGGAPAAAAPVPAQAAAPKAAPIDRFAVRAVPAPAVGMAMHGLRTNGPAFVTDDGSGLATAVAAKLGARGVAAHVVREVPADAGFVVFLGGMRAVSSVDEAVAVNREAFRVARAIAPRFAAQGGVFVTVQDTGGDFGLRGAGTRAWLGGVSALARTAALEWPAASVKAIDCERGGRGLEAIAEAIVGELFGGGPMLEVGLHADGTRTTMATRKMAAEPGPARLDESSVVVASGGARGVTAAALIALAKARQPRLVLLGRTALEPEPRELEGIVDEAGLKRALAAKMQAEGQKPVPSEIAARTARILAGREVRATLGALAAAGSQVKYVPVDVQDASALSAALDDVRKHWGPITAVVHGAGVLADKRIVEKTDAHFDRVFDTKVAGLRALLDATADDPLEALVVFSSVAARTGNPGQSDYAMANEVLNLVACAERARRGPACIVRSLAWGPWEGGMVTPALKSHFEQMGVALIPLDVGARMLVAELESGGDDVTLVVGGAHGEGPLGASVVPQANVDVHVTATTHPQLADHRVAGAVVVPVVMVIEWFLRAARACRPDRSIASLRGLKVLRGIKLSHFDGEGDDLTVRCKQLSDGPATTLAVELRGKNEALHYAATVTMSPEPPVAPAAAEAPKVERFGGVVYDGHVLFHGPKFQVIRHVDGVSRDGAVGALAGGRAAGWPGGPWRTDPALLDGGLQLAVLWAQEVLGGASLPMAVGEYRTYAGGLAEGPIRCVVYGKQVHDARAVCDVAFIGADGALVAEMLGVETVLRPGETKSAAAPAQA